MVIEIWNLFGYWDLEFGISIVMPKSNSKVKVGVIGCGTVAGYGHLPTVANHPDCELYAIAELDKTRLNEIGDKYSIPKERRFLRYRELLTVPELEAVTVSTRVEQHHQVVLDAAKSKKHISAKSRLHRRSKKAGKWLKPHG